jgi:hypothetical protein
MLRRFPFRAQKVRQYSSAVEKWVNNVNSEQIELSNGVLELKTGHMARFANAAATVSCGNSTVSDIYRLTHAF